MNGSPQFDLAYFTVPAATVGGNFPNSTALNSTVLATLDAVVSSAVPTTYDVLCRAATAVSEGGPVCLQGAGKLVAIQVGGP